MGLKSNFGKIKISPFITLQMLFMLKQQNYTLTKVRKVKLSTPLLSIMTQ